MEPIILLGMPRSGTKLLRSFLNQHPKINVPGNESYLIHNSLKKFGKNFDFSQRENRVAFFEFLSATKFYRKCQDDGIVFSFEEFDNWLSVYDWPHVFKLIFNFYGPKGYRHQFLWGDKSPGTFSQLEYIHLVFPNAQIIHLVRDPRDYCLSAKKAWGKNIFRSVHRWNSEIKYFHNIVQKLSLKNIIIKYEDLIDSPTLQLKNICSFLNIEYYPGMETLKSRVENIGSTKGEVNVVKDNKEKYLSAFSGKVISKLEGIAMEGMDLVRYDYNYNGSTIKVSTLYLNYAFVLDGMNALKFHIRNKGILKGISYFKKLHANKK